MSFLDKEGLRYFWQGAKKKFYNKSEIDSQREELQKGIDDASKTGGVEVGTIVGWTGGEVPEGYEENSTMLSAIANAFFPLGYTFIDTTGTIDYSNHLGLVWQKTLQGVTPIGQNANDTDFATVGKTGGAKTHTLTGVEMPSHTHGIRTLYEEETWSNSRACFPHTGFSWSTKGQEFRNEYAVNNPILKEGNNQPHNNLQPYQVVTFWTRVG